MPSTTAVLDVAQTAAEEQTVSTTAPSAIQFSEDFAAFKRIYRAARTAWRDQSVNPLTANYGCRAGVLGREIPNTYGARFGIEIEFDAGNVDRIASDLYNANLTNCDYQRDYHSGDYSEWRFEEDGSVSGGEVITPILTDTEHAWTQIEQAVNIIVRRGGSASTQAGCHISIDIASLDDAGIKRLARLATTFEDVMYRLAANPLRGKERSEDAGRFIASTQRSNGYAASVASGHRLAENIDTMRTSEIRYALHRGTWLSLDGHRAEFRIFDSTLDLAILQTQVKIAYAMVRAAANADLEERLSEMPVRPRGFHRAADWRQPAEPGGSRPTRLTGQAWRKDSLAIREFVDMLFDTTEDREQVISLFAMNDWSWARRRRRYY